MSIDIAELRRLAEAATKGPYAVSEIGAGFEVAVGGEIFAQAQQVAGDVRHASRKANAAYIAAACTALPSLLDELEGLRNVLNEFVNLNVDIVCAKAADKRKIEALHDKAIAAIRAAEGKGDE